MHVGSEAVLIFLLRYPPHQFVIVLCHLSQISKQVAKVHILCESAKNPNLFLGSFQEKASEIAGPMDDSFKMFNTKTATLKIALKKNKWQNQVAVAIGYHQLFPNGHYNHYQHT